MKHQSNELKVMSWNARDGLADTERAHEIADVIAEQEPDIAFICEAAGHTDLIDRTAKRHLQKNIGNVYVAEYNDMDNRQDSHCMMMTIKPDLGIPVIHPNVGRNGFYLSIPRYEILVAAYHGYDRDIEDVTRSEALRVKQARHIISRLGLTDANDTNPTKAVVMGDMNSIHSHLLRARTLRAFTPIADLLPSEQPGQTYDRLKRLGSLSQRLCRMALGGPLQEFEKVGFEDVDDTMKPTMKKGPIAVQLDHIMTRNIDTDGTYIVNADSLTDHDAVVTQLSVVTGK